MNENEEIEIFFDNDASASSYGWNFQVNAGIFLFLHYIQDAKSVKIESKNEDIEICLKNENKIFAQAKSIQNECSSSSSKNKMKEALLSLVKVPTKDGDVLIYISNIREPIDGVGKYFENKIVKYEECLESTKEIIKCYVGELSDAVEEKLKEKGITDKKKKRYEVIKEKMEEIDLSKLQICSIYPYFGDEANRYSEIYNKIIDVLANVVKLDSFDVRYISQKLLQHWQLVFEHNSTIKDGSQRKKITKEDFIWPIAVFLSDLDDVQIDDCMSYMPDFSLKNEADAYLNSSATVYHERFEFVNQVLRAYETYKRSLSVENMKISPEKAFIKDKYRDFWEEYADIDDEDVREYVLKASIYKIIINNRKVAKISKVVGM